MTDLIILAGTRDTVPDDLLSAHIRYARHGNRLLVVDEGGLASLHADQSRDLVIDPARGNWDIATDCRDEGECRRIANALIGEGPYLLVHLASLTLTDLLLSALEEPRIDLERLSAKIRAMPLDTIKLPPEIDDPQDRIAYTVRAMLHTAAGTFPHRDRLMPLASFRRWYDNPAGRVLYLLAPPQDDLAAAIRRAILATRGGLTATAPDHALVEFGSASERGGKLAA